MPVEKRTANVAPLTTPLVEQMAVFPRWLTVLILLIAGLLRVYGFFVGHMAFADMFLAVVGLSVAAIPEGLPAVLTITLAIGVALFIIIEVEKRIRLALRAPSRVQH